MQAAGAKNQAYSLEHVEGLCQAEQTEQLVTCRMAWLGESYGLQGLGRGTPAEARGPCRHDANRPVMAIMVPLAVQRSAILPDIARGHVRIRMGAFGDLVHRLESGVGTVRRRPVQIGW